MATEETQPNSEDHPDSPEATMPAQEARFDTGDRPATPEDIMPAGRADSGSPGASASSGEPQSISPETSMSSGEPQLDSPEASASTEDLPPSEQVDQPAPVTYRPISKLTSRILAVSAVLITALLAALTVAAYTVIPQALSEIERVASLPVTVANPVTEVEVTNPVTEVEVTNPVTEVEIANPVNEVKVANPVTEVEVTNPVTEVEVTNPVREVEVTNVVQTGAPRNAAVTGHCYESSFGDGYRVSIVAYSGGIQHTVAEGSFTPEGAAGIGVAMAEYYQRPYLEFGDRSGSTTSDCAHLSGWR